MDCLFESGVCSGNKSSFVYYFYVLKFRMSLNLNEIEPEHEYVIGV